MFRPNHQPMTCPPHSRFKKSVIGLLLVASAALTGCSYTVNAVNPKPNVVVPGGESATYRVNVSAVPDEFEVENITVKEFRKTLARGFQNAVGSKYAKDNQPASIRLVFDKIEMRLSNLGRLGKFANIQFRAKWVTGDGKVLAEVAGNASPRNPMEPGDRHLEDVVEVMYEKLIEGLDRVVSNTAPRATVPAMP